MDTAHITMYVTKNCADCVRSKQWFNTHNISYQEIDIERHEDATTFVEQVNNGKQSIPTIVFPDRSMLAEPTNEELEEKIKELGLI